ncbi:hypothetical protein [Variovorax sp. HW608]|uniref:hypothetical protein n=1 Tax=Variovorax sp. HW608 TaxID=1034889 RepID=UPI0012FD9164|nr:hypothetical protein [Variovorax sp. HW608]
MTSLSGIQWVQQTGTAPAFTTSAVPLQALGVFPGAVGRVAFGTFRSPDYENAARVIPPTGTLTGTPTSGIEWPPPLGERHEEVQ